MIPVRSGRKLHAGVSGNGVVDAVVVGVMSAVQPTVGGIDDGTDSQAGDLSLLEMAVGACRFFRPRGFHGLRGGIKKFKSLGFACDR